MNTYCSNCGHKSVFFGESNRPKSCPSCGFGEKVTKKKVSAKSKQEKKQYNSSEIILQDLLLGLLKNAKGKNDQLAETDDQSEDEDI